MPSATYLKKFRKNWNKYMQDYRRRNPWVKIYSNLKTRCTNRKRVDWPRYGGRGIKCLITPAEIRTLWFRDKAAKMEWPTFDRRDNDGNYTLANCCFIEHREHSRKSILGRPRNHGRLVRKV